MFLRNALSVYLIVFCLSASASAMTCSEILENGESALATAESSLIAPAGNSNLRLKLTQVLQWLGFKKNQSLQRQNDKILAVQGSIETVLNEAVENSFLATHPDFSFWIEPIRNPVGIPRADLQRHRQEILRISQSTVFDSNFISEWQKSFEKEIETLKEKWISLRPVDLFSVQEWNDIYKTIKFPTPMFYNLALKFAPNYFQTYLHKIDKRIHDSRENLGPIPGLAWIGSIAAGSFVVESNPEMALPFVIAGVGIPLAIFVHNWMDIFKMESNNNRVQMSEQAVRSVLESPSEELSEYQLAIGLYEKNKLQSVSKRIDELRKTVALELESPDTMTTTINSTGRVNRLISGTILTSALFTKHPFFDVNRVTIERLRLAQAFEYGVGDLSTHDTAAVEAELNLMNKNVLLLKRLLQLLEQMVDINAKNQRLNPIVQSEARVIRVTNMMLIKSLRDQIRLLDSSYSEATESFERVDSIARLIDASEVFRTELLRTGGLLTELKPEE